VRSQETALDRFTDTPTLTRSSRSKERAAPSVEDVNFGDDLFGAETRRPCSGGGDQHRPLFSKVVPFKLERFGQFAVPAGEDTTLVIAPFIRAMEEMKTTNDSAFAKA